MPWFFPIGSTEDHSALGVAGGFGEEPFCIADTFGGD
jgi:hypothetical protein